MEFIILSDMKEQVEKLFNRMHKHMKEASITFGNPRRAIQKTTCVFEEETKTYKAYLDVIDVKIEGIGLNEWNLVANIDYEQCAVIMCNKDLFKGMPKEFGLNYHVCDFCNHPIHHKAFVVYSNKTHEYKQVGESCMKKVCAQFKYLSAFLVNLYEIVDCIGGWSMDSEPGGWRVPDHYSKRAISFKNAIGICIDYSKNVNSEWEKAEWGEFGKIKDGTNDKLQSYDCKNTLDTDLIEKVFGYASKLEKTYEYEYEGYGELTLQGKIREAADCEFIAANEMYIAWFAMAGYQKEIASADFEKVILRHGIEKGMKVKVTGKLLAMNYVEGDYYSGPYYEAVIQGNDGLKYKKSLSHNAVLKPYTNENGEVNFEAEVKYIAMKNQYIGLGGRVRK